MLKSSDSIPVPEDIETMHLLIGGLISLLLIGMPLAFQAQASIPQPPANLTGWLIFLGAAFGMLGILNVLLTKLSIIPAIEARLASVPTKKEFDDHVVKDDEFQTDVRSFIERHDEDHEDRRHDARRRGDPR